MLWRFVRPSCLVRHCQRGFRQAERVPRPCTRSETQCQTTSRLKHTNAAHIAADDENAIPKLINHAALLKQTPPEGVPIKVAGNVHSKRTHKKVAFLFVGDGSTREPIQAVCSPDDVNDIQNGAYVELQGRWVQTQGRKQAHELHVDRVVRVGESDPEVSPLQKKSMTVEHLRSYPHLRLKVPLYSLLARVRHQVINSAHDFYSGTSSSDDESVFVQPPLVTSSDCEGAGEVFTIGRKPEKKTEASAMKQLAGSETEGGKLFFSTPKYLTVSSQLHLEAYSAELGHVWTLSPTFRAETSDTARHLAEFYMLEAEFRSITDLCELTSRTQRMIQHIARRLTNHRVGTELLAYHADPKHNSNTDPSTNLEARWSALQGSQWQTITYNDAINQLQAACRQHRSLFTFQPTWESGLQLEHERWIVTNLGNEKPVFVTHYPKAQKPFYMRPSSLTSGPDLDSSHETVACFDLLFPYGTCEVVGGSLREHRLEHLISSMRQKGLLVPSHEKLREDSPPSNNHEHDSKAEKVIDPKPEYPFLQVGESLNTLQWYADLRRFGSSPHGGFGMGFDRLLMYLTGVGNVREIVPFPRYFGRADC